MDAPRLTVDEIDTIRSAQVLLRRYAQDWISTAHDDRVEANRVADALRELTAQPAVRPVVVGTGSVTERLERIERLVRLLTGHFDLTYVHDSGGPL